MEKSKNRNPAGNGGSSPPGLMAAVEKLDHRIFFFCYEKMKNPVFDVLMPALSNIANRGILQTALGVALVIASWANGWDGRLLRAAACMGAATGVSGLFAEVTFKMIWNRKRPFDRLEGVTMRVSDKRLLRRPSFPSGHAAGYMASGVALSFYFPAFAPLIIPVALLGGYSRIYNGVHFPSDVAAGILIGAATGYYISPALDSFLKTLS